MTAKWKIWLAFGIIYFVWGSTFLAIRIGVREVPPFFLAAMRFSAAGAILLGWSFARGERAPTARQWLSMLLLAAIIFPLDYGLLFWSEQRVPSGLAALMLATIPVFMALAEILLLRTRKFSLWLGVALLIGIAGVTVLTGGSATLGGAPVDRSGAIALMVGSVSWAIASAFMVKLPLPASKSLSSGAQMLIGGILLTLTAAALGEFRDLHLSSVSRGVWIALLYLVVAGSVIAFTAYVWLLHHESPTRVGTYAYVNPVVAVVLGYFFAGEPLGPRTILGAVLILVSVVLITRLPRSSAPG